MRHYLKSTGTLVTREQFQNFRQANLNLFICNAILGELSQEFILFKKAFEKQFNCTFEMNKAKCCTLVTQQNNFVVLSQTPRFNDFIETKNLSFNLAYDKLFIKKL